MEFAEREFAIVKLDFLDSTVGFSFVKMNAPIMELVIKVNANVQKAGKGTIAQ